ncbi:hypothetical protein QTP88_024366 [Uroleucon formosanum]
MSSLPRAPDCLNASEWEVISDCVKILKPFENITSELSGENYPTLLLVIPLIQGFQYMLKNLRTETTIGIEFKNKLIDVVGRRLGNLEKDKIVAKSTLLDPRLKKTAFGLQENADNAHKWICEELTNTIRAKNDNTEITESDTTQSTSSAIICSVWKHFDDKVAQVKITSNPNATASIMIRQYLEIPPLDRKKNPLEFWKQYEVTFPELYKMQLKCNSTLEATVFPMASILFKDNCNGSITGVSL